MKIQTDFILVFAQIKLMKPKINKFSCRKQCKFKICYKRVILFPSYSRSEHNNHCCRKALFIDMGHAEQFFHQLIWITASKRSLCITSLKLCLLILQSCHCTLLKQLSEQLCLTVRLQNPVLNHYLCKRGHFAENYSNCKGTFLYENLP